MKRNLLNVVMILSFLLTMSFHFLPKILHEVLGIFWLLAVFAHLYINRSWFFSLFKGKWIMVRGVSSVINALLLIFAVVVTGTGVIISNHLFKGWFGMEMARSITVHQLHVSLPFVMMILMGVHLGLHWQGLWQRFFAQPFANTRSLHIASRIGIAALFALGVYGSFENRIGDRLLMKHIFGTKATELPFGIFLSLFVGILALYVGVGYLLQKILTAQARDNRR